MSLGQAALNVFWNDARLRCLSRAMENRNEAPARCTIAYVLLGRGRASAKATRAIPMWITSISSSASYRSRSWTTSQSPLLTFGRGERPGVPQVIATDMKSPPRCRSYRARSGRLWSGSPPRAVACFGTRFCSQRWGPRRRPEQLNNAGLAVYNLRRTGI